MPHFWNEIILDDFLNVFGVHRREEKERHKQG
jgi:hypothetical protein